MTIPQFDEAIALTLTNQHPHSNVVLLLNRYTFGELRHALMLRSDAFKPCGDNLNEFMYYDVRVSWSPGLRTDGYISGHQRGDE